MSSRREDPTRTTGAHRAVADRARHRGQRPADPAGRSAARRPLARYEPYLDGLFTYCLSVMCEHDAATEVLGGVLAQAKRRAGRPPADPAQYRSWLYALARWTCLQRLADKHRPPPPALSEAAAAQRRRELSALAWPEAAGTTPEQREALELAVRHGLSPQEVTAVLGRERDDARALLATAACEVERTRAALVVVERGHCPAVARLTGDNQVLLSAGLRRELVRHVDDCTDCRHTAERASAAGPWPGSTTTPGTLPVLGAPRPAAHAAMLSALRPHAGGARRDSPRYDRRGFPVDPKDRSARLRVIRSRAVTTTVVATVVAAPVLALWTAYRTAPLGEGRPAGSLTATEEDGPAAYPYDPAGHAGPGDAGPGIGPESFLPGFSKESTTRSDRRAGGPLSGTGRTGEADADRRSGPARGPGRLTVDAQPSGDTTLITLTASGGAPVHWSARADAPWLLLSRTAGVLRPGESVTITVAVDRAREPETKWTARVTVDPAGAVVPISGRGAPAQPGPEPEPTPTEPSPSPSEPTPSEPEPSSPPPSDGTEPGPSGS